jgi:hypothetical protein
VKFVATKKGKTTNFFHPSLFVAVFAFWIRNPGWVKIRIRDPGSWIRDPGSGINIPDPQHCINGIKKVKKS